ncbi:MAG: AAA family ATPase, partial [Candidatus Methanoplasma sp.]|nr:AAA family ATPase [Candidatus Methanoplasma sp.]
MKRSIESRLLDWKNDRDRKPLLLVGARQVGKSHSVIEFGRANYANVAVFNFEGNETLRKIFDRDLDPDRIITELEAFSSQTIVPRETLVFFDEIQACSKAITSLKYFYEQHPDYHIIAAGSLLGSYLVREPISFPVGKVNILTMYPMTFLEFLTEMNPAAIPLIKEAFEKNVQFAL